MKKAAYIVAIILATATYSLASSPTFCVSVQIPTIELGMLNEHAKILPMPQIDSRNISRVKKDIHVRVHIDLQSGGVKVAAANWSLPRAVRESVEKAARDAKFKLALNEFPEVQGAGTIVFKRSDFNRETITNNVPSPIFTREEGLKDTAVSLPVPRPVAAGDSLFKGQVRVAVIVNTRDGKVAAVNAVYGLDILHPAGERAAYQAKFSPSVENGDGPAYILGTLIYDIGGEGVGVAEGMSPANAVAYAEPIEIPGIVVRPCGSRS